MNDKLLIEQVRAGDHSAYSEIVRAYQARILQLCISMLSDRQEAEDAAQEIFVKAFYAVDRFKGQSSFYTWLYRIASNHCLDLGRKKSRRKALSWDKLLEEKGDFIERILLKEKPPGEDKGAQELVHQALGSLPDDYRLILTLREIQELSYEEIAETLQCSLAAVKGRLKRAREDLREKLQSFLESDVV